MGSSSSKSPAQKTSLNLNTDKVNISNIKQDFTTQEEHIRGTKTDSLSTSLGTIVQITNNKELLRSFRNEKERIGGDNVINMVKEGNSQKILSELEENKLTAMNSTEINKIQKMNVIQESNYKKKTYQKTQDDF
jgi:hypothetical protein